MRIVETIYYGHVPPARDRRTSKGCLGVVLRATRGDRNNIPYNMEEILAKNVIKIYIKEVFIRYRVLSKIILNRDLRFIVVF